MGDAGDDRTPGAEGLRAARERDLAVCARCGRVPLASVRDRPSAP
jgi:hypothetical protein